MTTAITRNLGEANGDPTGTRPSRTALLEPMLTKTARGGVPVRRAFLQRKPNASKRRGAALAELVRTRDHVALDAYLLITRWRAAATPTAPGSRRPRGRR